MRRIEASIVPQMIPASGRGTSFRSSCFADIQKNLSTKSMSGTVARVATATHIPSLT